MYIDSIRIENFRTYRHAEIELLRPLGLESPDRLVAVQGTQSLPDILDWHAQAKTFDGFGGFAYWGWDRPGPPPVQNALVVSTLLLLFAIVPNEASRPPRPWRGTTAAVSGKSLTNRSGTE